MIGIIASLICFTIGIYYIIVLTKTYKERDGVLCVLFLFAGFFIMFLTDCIEIDKKFHAQKIELDTIQINNMSPYIEIDGNYISTDELRGIVRKSKTRKAPVSLEFYYDSCTLTIPFSSEEEQEIAIKQLREQLIDKQTNIGFKNTK